MMTLLRIFLLLTFACCANAQTKISIDDGTGHKLTQQVQSLSGTSKAVKWPGTNGTAGYILSTNGANPAILSWTPELSATDAIITDPATATRNTILGTAPGVIDLILKNPDDATPFFEAKTSAGIVGTSLSSTFAFATGSLILGTQLEEIYGGTNQSSYATGDILYASASNTLSKRTIGSTGDVLTVAGGVPTWAPTSSGGVTSISAGAGITNTPNPITATGTVALDYTHANTWTALQQSQIDNLHATFTKGLASINTTAATSLITQQISPSLMFGSRVWNTSVSKSFNGWLTFVPVSGVTPTGNFIFSADYDGAGPSEVARITNDGGFYVSGSDYISSGAAGYRIMASAPAAGHYLRSNGTSFVDGTIQISDVPTIMPMTTLGDVIYEDATPAPARLAGNGSNYIKFLSSTATTGVAQAPAWSNFLTNYGKSNSVFVGGSGNSSVSGNENVAIGGQALHIVAGGGGNVAIGSNALTNTTSGTYNIGIGDNCGGGFATNSSNMIAIGQFAGNTALGAGATTDIFIGYGSGNNTVIGVSNTFMCGSINNTIKDVYFGDGDFTQSANGPTWTLHGTGGNGTDKNGGNLGIAAGKGTGAGASGVINFQASTPLGTGTTVQTLSTMLTVGLGKFQLSSVTSTVAGNATVLDGQHLFYIIPANGGVPVTVAAPTGATGNVIYVENLDLTATTLVLAVLPGVVTEFVYDGITWKHVQ